MSTTAEKTGHQIPEIQPYRRIDRLLWAANKEPDHKLMEYGYDCFADRWLVDSLDKADLVSSLTTRGTHAPVLDIDYPASLYYHHDGNDYLSKPAFYDLHLVVKHDCPQCKCIESATAELRQFARFGFEVFPYDREWGLHLDLYFPARLIPSATEGHSHLYLDTEMPWEDYKKLLSVMAEYGIIERGFALRSELRGMSFLRHPADSKKDEHQTDPAFKPDPADASYPAWMNPAWVESSWIEGRRRRCPPNPGTENPF